MNRSDAYRVDALLELAAAHPGSLTASSLARRRGVPAAFLGRLLAAMARNGLVATSRGPGGGVRLTRPPRQVTLDGVLPAGPSPTAGGAAVAWLAAHLASARTRELAGLSLADLLAVEQRLADSPDWQI